MLISVIRITAKPVTSTYSLLPLLPVATSTQSCSRWVTLRAGESPFMPVARTTKRWRPGAIVPVLIVSVELVPLPLVGTTAAGLKLVVPIPAGSGPSRDRLTLAP